MPRQSKVKKRCIKARASRSQNEATAAQEQLDDEWVEREVESVEATQHAEDDDFVLLSDDDWDECVCKEDESCQHCLEPTDCRHDWAESSPSCAGCQRRESVHQRIIQNLVRKFGYDCAFVELMVCAFNCCSLFPSVNTTL